MQPFFTFGRPITEKLPIVVIKSPSRPPTEEEEKIEFRGPEWKEARSLRRQRKRGVPWAKVGDVMRPAHSLARPARFSRSLSPIPRNIQSMPSIQSCLFRYYPPGLVCACLFEMQRRKCRKCTAPTHTHTHTHTHTLLPHLTSACCRSRYMRPKIFGSPIAGIGISLPRPTWYHSRSFNNLSGPQLTWMSACYFSASHPHPCSSRVQFAKWQDSTRHRIYHSLSVMWDETTWKSSGCSVLPICSTSTPIRRHGAFVPRKHQLGGDNTYIHDQDSDGRYSTHYTATTR